MIEFKFNCLYLIFKTIYTPPLSLSLSSFKLTAKFSILKPSPSLPLISLITVTLFSQAEPGTGDKAVLVEDSSEAIESRLLVSPSLELPLSAFTGSSSSPTPPPPPPSLPPSPLYSIGDHRNINYSRGLTTCHVCVSINVMRDFSSTCSATISNYF